MTPLSRAMQVQMQMQFRSLLRRRPFSSNSSSTPGVKRYNVFEELDELEAKTQREIIEDIENFQKFKMPDRDALDRLLTYWGWPNGELRNRVVFGCNVAAIFVASRAVVAWIAERDAQHEHAEFGSNASV